MCARARAACVSNAEDLLVLGQPNRIYFGSEHGFTEVRTGPSELSGNITTDESDDVAQAGPQTDLPSDPHSRGAVVADLDGDNRCGLETKLM